MSSVQYLIQAAYREGNLVPVGQQPTAAEQNEAVDAVNRTITNMLALERSANFYDFMAVAAVTGTVALTKHTRIVLLFPAPADDGARMALIPGVIATGTLTLSGNGFTIGGAATKSSVGPAVASLWFFRADIGDWRLVKPLALADDFLFPPEFDDFFATVIAARLAPRYGKTVTVETQAVIQAGIAAFAARYFQGGRLNIAATNLQASAASPRWTT